MYALAQAYLTGREIGESEAYYKLEPSLHYKQSNIKTIFLSTGFFSNRSRFLRKCKPDEEGNPSKTYTVDDHEGKFVLTETIHTKYSERPDCIEKISLTQFTMRYTDVSPQTKTKIKESGRIPTAPIPELGYEGILTIVTGYEEDNPNLQDFIVLKNERIMNLRRFDAVIRRHKFDFEKDPHQYYYSELLLFYPWRDESELFPDDFQKCQDLFKSQEQNISTVKTRLFPHLHNVEAARAMVEAFEENSRIADKMDAEGEQANDPEQIAEMAEEYEGLDPENLVENDQFENGSKAAPSFFRTTPILDTDDLQEKNTYIGMGTTLCIKTNFRIH